MFDNVGGLSKVRSFCGRFHHWSERGRRDGAILGDRADSCLLETTVIREVFGTRAKAGRSKITEIVDLCPKPVQYFCRRPSTPEWAAPRRPDFREPSTRKEHA